jgi:predicted Zn-dependent protease
MNVFDTVAMRHAMLVGVLLLLVPCAGAAPKNNKKAAPTPKAAEASDEKKSDRARLSADVDRQAKLLFEKAMELMEYKQYERGLAMLNSIVRDNQGNILAHRANMAMGKHIISSQNKPKEALNYFMLSDARTGPGSGREGGGGGHRALP